jgi:hypothetical protein
MSYKIKSFFDANAAFKSGRFPNYGTTAGDTNAASPEPLGSSGGTVPSPNYGSSFCMYTLQATHALHARRLQGVC